jgi:hypothetical protein
MDGSLVQISGMAAFTLYDRPRHANGGWRSLKLTCPTRQKKRAWWLGWNGERLARNHDAGLLADHEPEIYRWVIQCLSGCFI